MTTDRKSPAHIWEALRRLRACNKTELAADLGITRQTLNRWTRETEAGNSPGKDAEQRASALLIATLRAANADVHAQWSINWHQIGTIAGRK